MPMLPKLIIAPNFIESLVYISSISWWPSSNVVLINRLSYTFTGALMPSTYIDHPVSKGIDITSSPAFFTSIVPLILVES